MLWIYMNLLKTKSKFIKKMRNIKIFKNINFAFKEIRTINLWNKKKK